MVTVEEIRRAQRAEGPATVLAIGTAVPPNCVDQTTFPDYYFRITNSDHMTQLKQQFKLICEKTTIEKRYMHLTEELVNENPNIAAYMAPSLTARQDIVAVEVPKLAKEAAEKAIKEWGQPKSSITHLVFCTSSTVTMPSADCRLIKLLALSPSVNRSTILQQGCFGGASALRCAKDLAENNAGTRVLVVCSEITTCTFRGPTETDLQNLVGQALFADGAAALIVGSDPVVGAETPLFQIISARQTVVPDSEKAISLQLVEAGLVFHISKEPPGLISRNIERRLEEALGPLGISDWNSIFWIAHPGGPAILNEVEKVLGLSPDKLRFSRQVLKDYGNPGSPTVLIIMDEMRKSAVKEGRSSTGDGLDWGVLAAFGPGLTIETVVLRSLPI